MTTSISRAIVAIGAALVGVPVIAQSVTARQATPQEIGYEVIASPMLLDISLGANGKRPSLGEIDEQHTWTATDTSRFVCDKARLEMVQIWKSRKGGRVSLRVRPIFQAWAKHKTIELTGVVVSDGKEVRRSLMRVDMEGDDEGSPAAVVAVRLPRTPLSFAAAIPSGGGKKPTPEFDFDLSDQEFVAMFAGGAAPTLRLILDIQ